MNYIAFNVNESYIPTIKMMQQTST